MAAVAEHGNDLIEREDRIDDVHAVGVDETAFLRASPTRSTIFATGIVDLHRGKLIDIVGGRSRKVLADWLAQQPTEWIERIAVAALDPFRG
jgi:transposase